MPRRTKSRARNYGNAAFDEQVLGKGSVIGKSKCLHGAFNIAKRVKSTGARTA